MYSDGSSCCSNSQRGVFVPAAWNLESKLTKVSQILLRNRASSNVCPNVLFWLAELARIFNEIPARERENLKLIFSSWIKNHQPIRSAIIDLLCKNIYLPSCVIAPPPLSHPETALENGSAWKIVTFEHRLDRHESYWNTQAARWNRQ